MNVLLEIKDHIIPFINWIIFLLVITSGYIIRATKLLPNISTTLKVLFTSLVVTISYSIAEEISIGVYIASFFLAFGFHGAFLKLLEISYKSVVNRIKTGKIEDLDGSNGNEPEDFAETSVAEVVGNRPDDR